MYLARKRRVLFFLILWRLASVFVVQTAHVPDEYWQSLEVAHRLTFGYGYLTWEWTEKIRSYAYPFVVSVVYKLLALLSLDYASVLTTLPRLIQAVFTAYAEYRFYEWTRNKWTLYSLCINWYWYYCATRTLINTAETACTMIALSMFPWRDSNVRNVNYMWIVGFLCMARPTAVVVWMPLCLYHFCTSTKNKLVLACQYGLICSGCFLGSVLLDSYHYGALVVTPWEFFRVNVLYKVGDLYGKEHLSWYFLSGLPVLLGLYYVIFLLSVWEIMKCPARYHRQAILLLVIGWTIGVFSLLSHKEFRFLLPLLPMTIYICTSCTFSLNIKFSTVARKIFIALLIFSNVFPALYFCVVHQRGSLDVMKVLREDIVRTNDTSTNLLFLTPCHATPLYSHLHVNVPARILTCEPNFEKSEDYMDEADVFFDDPVQWLNDNYKASSHIELPSHLIIFENIVHKITKFLRNYELVSKVFHTHFPQSNYGKYIYVYKRKVRL